MQQSELEAILSLIDFVSSQQFQAQFYSLFAALWTALLLIYFRKPVSEFIIGLLSFLWHLRYEVLGTTFAVFLYFNWQELMLYFFEFYWIVPFALIGFVGADKFFGARRIARAEEQFEDIKRNVESAKFLAGLIDGRIRREQQEKERRDFCKKPFIGISPPKSKEQLEFKKRQKEEEMFQRQIDSEVYPLRKPFYLRKELNQEHIKFLKERNFVEARLTGFGPGRNAYLVAKPVGNESIKHFFLTELIAREVRHYTGSVQTYSRDQPDIVFDCPKGKIAVEVETGNTIKKDRKRILRKIERLKKFDGFFFVVTDAEFKKLYAELAPTFTRFTVRKQVRKCFFKRRKSSCAGKTKAKTRVKREKKGKGESN